jgi:hypothetical protein
MPDGTIYAGSLYEGGNFRVPPGATTAEQWVKPRERFNGLEGLGHTFIVTSDKEERTRSLNASCPTPKSSSRNRSDRLT